MDQTITGLSFKQQEKIKRKRIRHEFLLTFFNSKSGYDVREIHGFILVKQFNRVSNTWEVAIHTKESFAKVKAWKQQQTLL